MLVSVFLSVDWPSKQSLMLYAHVCPGLYSSVKIHDVASCTTHIRSVLCCCDFVLSFNDAASPITTSLSIL